MWLKRILFAAPADLSRHLDFRWQRNSHRPGPLNSVVYVPNMAVFVQILRIFQEVNQYIQRAETQVTKHVFILTIIVHLIVFLS